MFSGPNWILDLHWLVSLGKADKKLSKAVPSCRKEKCIQHIVNEIKNSKVVADPDVGAPEKLQE